MTAYSPYENVSSRRVSARVRDRRPQRSPGPILGAGQVGATVCVRHNTGASPILLKTEMGAGHFGSTGRYDAWRDEAEILAFLVDALSRATSAPGGHRIRRGRPVG